MLFKFLCALKVIIPEMNASNMHRNRIRWDIFIWVWSPAEGPWWIHHLQLSCWALTNMILKCLDYLITENLVNQNFSGGLKGSTESSKPFTPLMEPLKDEILHKHHFFISLGTFGWQTNRPKVIQISSFTPESFYTNNTFCAWGSCYTRLWKSLVECVIFEINVLLRMTRERYGI